MNLAERKIKLIEKILHIVNEENVSRFEEIFERESLDSSTIVAHTINERAISLQEYRDKNKRAVTGYAEGKFKTSQEIVEKFKARE